MRKPRNSSGHFFACGVGPCAVLVGEPDVRHALHPGLHHLRFQVFRLCKFIGPLNAFNLKHNSYVVGVVRAAVNPEFLEPIFLTGRFVVVVGRSPLAIIGNDMSYKLLCHAFSPQKLSNSGPGIVLDDRFHRILLVPCGLVRR